VWWRRIRRGKEVVRGRRTKAAGEGGRRQHRCCGGGAGRQRTGRRVWTRVVGLR
jgi:hypothetical protein